MSASSKKKLRKEQNAANLTEKQRQEQLEAKKLKAYSIIFIALMAVVVVTAIVVMTITGINRSGIIQKNTVALTVGEHEVNSVEMSYYYNDLISNNYNNWYDSYGESMESYMLLMGLDMSAPLDQQLYTDGEITWAEHFIDSAIEKAKSDYVLYDMAVADGHEMTAEEQENLDYSEENMILYAQLYGYSSIEDYLVAMYGFGADLESYRQYSERNALATSYYNAHQAALSYDDAAIRAHDEENFNNYSSFDYAAYYVNRSDYLEGGTTTEGTTVYSDEDYAAAEAAAKKVADELAQSEDLIALDKAIATLEANADDDSAATTKYESTLYTSVSTFYRDWLAEDGRKEGDMTVVANEATTTDDEGNETTTLYGYYVVVYQGRNDNQDPTASVRHILAEFECSEEDEHDHTEYTEDEKAAAKAEAEELLQTWKDGEATEDTFSALATEKTDDTASSSTGGLYEDLYAGASYEEAFLDWAIDPARKVGDTGIVETSYGYHVMYFVGHSDLSYRDQMITDALTTQDMEAWYDGMLETVTTTKGDTSYLNTSLVLVSE